MIRSTFLILLWLSCQTLSAQLTTMVGDEAPRITPTEYLMNGLKKSDLKGKFLALTLCKSWDQPCFNDLPHLDSLRTAFPNDEMVYLTLFRGETEMAVRDTKGKNFGVSLATDLYGNTQISYGDGETGLVGWPLTFLIDDENTVRWQGDGDDLTVEVLARFLAEEHPVIDLNKKYVPLDPGDFLFEPMTLTEVSDLWQADSVASFVRVWDKADFSETSFRSMYSHSLDFGAYGPATLEEIFQQLFPRKRLVVPGELMDRQYRVAFVQRTIDRTTADQIANQIFEEIGLQASVSSLPATFFELEVNSKGELDKPRKVSVKNRLPEGMKDLGNYKDEDLHNFEVRKYSLASLAKLLNKYSPDRWSYTGNHRKEYNFILDVSSTKALLKSLRAHGIGATGKAGTVEEIGLERIR